MNGIEKNSQVKKSICIKDETLTDFPDFKIIQLFGKRCIAKCLF